MGQERKKVLVLLSSPFEPDPRLSKEARTLVRNGYEVTVLAWDREGGGRYRASEEVDGIQIERIVVRSGYGLGVRQVLPILLFWFKALRRGLGMKYHIVHACDLNTLPVGFFLAKLRRAQLLYDSWERYPEMHRGLMPAMVVRLLHVLEWFLVHWCDAVMAASPVIALELERISGRKVVVINNAAEMERYAQVSEDLVREERRSLGVSDCELLVAYIGTYAPSRNIERLIHAVQISEGVKALIVGDMEKSVIPVLAGRTRNVVYLGWVGPERIPLYTRVADVIYFAYDPVCPHAKYAAPNALFSAIAAGRAIIATGVGVLPCLISETGCGVILRDAEVATIASVIGDLAHDRQRLRSLWHAASVASQRYNWEYTERDLLRVYEQLT